MSPPKAEMGIKMAKLFSNDKFRFFTKVGLIYIAPIEDLPISASLGMLETLAQPLLFSIVVTFQRKKQ